MGIDTTESRENEDDILYLEELLINEGVDGEANSKSADVSIQGISAAVESHPDEEKIYICGKHEGKGGAEFQAWISTSDGSTSENFQEIMRLLF